MLRTHRWYKSVKKLKNSCFLSTIIMLNLFFRYKECYFKMSRCFDPVSSCITPMLCSKTYQNQMLHLFLKQTWVKEDFFWPITGLCCSQLKNRKVCLDLNLFVVYEKQELISKRFSNLLVLLWSLFLCEFNFKLVRCLIISRPFWKAKWIEIRT